MNQNRKPQCPGPFPQGIETAMAYGVPAQYGQQAKHKRLCRKASFNHWHQRVHTGKQHSRQQPDHPGRNTAFFHQQGKQPPKDEFLPKCNQKQVISPLVTNSQRLRFNGQQGQNSAPRYPPANRDSISFFTLSAFKPISCGNCFQPRSAQAITAASISGSTTINS